MQNKDTQENILKVASGLFASKGYSSVSMRDIAAAVGVTVANLYYHFTDKEELIRASLAYVFSERLSPLEGLVKQHASPDDRLEAFVSWFVREIFGEEPSTRLILRELLDGTEERLEYLAKTLFNEPFALLSNLIAECADTLDPVMTAVSVASLVLGSYQLARLLPYLPGGRSEHSSIDTVTRHVLMVLRATFQPCEGLRKV
ncbi:MAG: TetR/AcrR family transcriptional regulator [Oryzomonas sp.]|jgi:AcrR family transcriptional regulator